jgi:peptidoglycan L-alanyl-D-glutamate endopeptidase CwlK
MRGIDKLHPELQLCVNKFLAECKKQGLKVLVTETLRTSEEQEELYAQGRTNPGNIVTNARGYQSPHAWGVAFDFCRNEKGREYDNSDGFFEFVGEIAKTIFDGTEYDLFWGGDFKSFVDKPHIEMIKYLPNNSTKWLIDTYGTPEEFMKTWEVEKVEEVSEWAKTAWNWCKEKGYLDGTNPKGTVTREMLAQVLFNLFGKEK